MSRRYRAVGVVWHSARVDEAELKALGREQLGRQVALVGSELKHIARALEPGEVPRRFAMGMRGRHGLLVLLTDRRLLLGRGWSPIPGRDRVEAWPLAELTGVTRHMLSLRAEFGDRGLLSLGLAPEGPALALTDMLRTDIGLPDAGPVRADLHALAKRKLGPKVASDMRADIALLADGLAPEEDVQRLAFAGDERGPLLAALTPERLLLVHAALRGAKDRWLAWPRAGLRAVSREGTVLALDAAGERVLIAFVAEERCDEFEAVLR
ncbi:MAG: hypothetical protein ACEQSX_01475 [Baekduiaceae bacterium]